MKKGIKHNTTIIAGTWGSFHNAHKNRSSSGFYFFPSVETYFVLLTKSD